jgi:hypothetical protein
MFAVLWYPLIVVWCQLSCQKQQLAESLEQNQAVLLTDFESEDMSKIKGRREFLLVNLDHTVQQRSYKILGVLWTFFNKEFVVGIVTDTTCV